MQPPHDLRAAGDRIEDLVDSLRENGDVRTRDMVEELLGLVTELYGAGLARVMELAGTTAPELVGVLATDELIGSLLMVHGLNPEPLGQRVEAALAGVRPLLSSHGGDVELLELDEEVGAVRLRLLGTCDGCPSSAITLKSAVERAILSGAPEIVFIGVDPLPAPAAGVPLELGPKRVYDQCPTELVAQ